MTNGTTRVDAFLCDAIEGAGGKLSALGIGWNQIMVPQFPVRHPRLGVGLVFHIPYTATNQAHEFFIHLENEDGELLPLADASLESDDRNVEDDKMVRIGGQLNLGRPAELPHGDEQIAALAVQLDGIEFPSSGRYAVVVTVDGTVDARLGFRLVQAQQITISAR